MFVIIDNVYAYGEFLQCVANFEGITLRTQQNKQHTYLYLHVLH